MLHIYKCVKDHKGICAGTYWGAVKGHYMFQKIECPTGAKKEFRFITPYELNDYFVELIEDKNKDKVFWI